MRILVEPVSPHPAVVDAAIDAYVCWREECTDARDAYCRWTSSPPADRTLASCAYLAAIDREEAAAGVYADAMKRLADACVDDALLEPRCESGGFW